MPDTARACADHFAEERHAPEPRLWLLMGTRVGDNNQLLALAAALGFAFEAKKLDFNQLRRIPLFRRNLTIVAHKSRALITPPWPDLVIAVGYGSVPVARYIRERSRGRTKLVHVGNPRERLSDFDLQITTPQYSRRSAPNLIELPFPIGNPAKAARPSVAERDWLKSFPHPRRLVAIGGPARHWQLDRIALAKAICLIKDKQPRGSVILATSARTDGGTRKLLANVAGEAGCAVVDDFPSFATLLAGCDEIYVTADSVSMLSEAIFSGKPVGMIPIKRSPKGLVTHWLWEKLTGRSTFPDFANFWNLLQRRGLIGTVEQPIASNVADTVEIAADAVRALLSPADAL